MNTKIAISALIATAIIAQSSVSSAAITTSPGITWMDIGGTFEPGNLAPAGTAFALNIEAQDGGTPTQPTGYGGIHTTTGVNDGTYGNALSWLAGTAGSHVGIALSGGLQSISSIAYSANNNLEYFTRHFGVVTVQYTQDATPTSGGSWTTIGTINHWLPDGQPLGVLRSRFDFAPVDATGIRLVTASNGRQFDEIEIYASPQGTATFDTLPLNTPVLFDESIHSNAPNLGALIPAEPGGQGQYRWVGPNVPMGFYPGPIEMNNVKVEVSWGVSPNHATDVDYYYDPDGPGPAPAVLLASGINHTLMANQLTTPGGVEWSGFFEIASNINLNPSGVFTIIGSGGLEPQAVASAVWQLTAVPEPSGLALAGMALMGLFSMRRRNR